MEQPGAAPLDFTTFIHAEYGQLVRAMTLYCGDPLLAQQIAHDALVRARERWDTVGRMESPGAWVHRVAVNLSNTWWRRQSAERRAYARAGGRRATEDQADPADVLAVRAALRALPPRQREVLVLRYFLDYSVADTARHTGLTQSSIKSLTYRAVAALRAHLGDTPITVPEVLHDA
jgi:RNA polymerase sigma-70 factor (sigma-E family)